METNAVRHTPSPGERQLSHGRITFLEAGSGMPVLMLHGLNGNARSWMPQLTGLADRFRIVAWDAPGYGGSDLAGSGIVDFARAGLELIGELFSEPVALVGHSFGGTIAMQMIALEPTRFSRVVFSCTHPGHGRSTDHSAAQRYNRRIEQFKTLPREEYGRRRARGMLPEGTPHDVFDTVAAVAAEARLEGTQAASQAMERCDLRPALPQIAIPALVITCGSDPVVKLERAMPLIESLPHCRHVRLPGLGHAPYYEDPDLYNSTISDFLTS